MAGSVVVDEAKVEFLKVWYSVFCTIMDAYGAGDYTGDEALAKVRQLREELRIRLPQVEEELRGR